MGDLSPEKVRTIVVGMIIFILSVAVHEFGHAFTADRLGDRLPRQQGRVTLNPMAHADPIGTLLLPFIFLATSGSIGFAWGKPVYHNTQDRKRRLLIAAAGPMMNIVLAVVVATIMVALVRFQVFESPTMFGSLASPEIANVLATVVFFNFILFFFNLIPARPLDGGSVVRGLIPESWVDAWDQYAVYAPFVFLAVLLIPKIQIIFVRPATEATLWLINNLLRLFGV